MKINIPIPELQIDFSYTLGQIRSVYLQEALSNTVEEVDLRLLDKQLSDFVPQEMLKATAKCGLRGELIFPVPCLLEKNPYLLGYYRLLLGFSQKEFYTSKFGISGFKSMEMKGLLTKRNLEVISLLCKELVNSLCALIDGIGINRLSKELLYDLTLLTVGPQLRGGANVRKGVVGIVDVFEAIHNIVKHASVESSSNKIRITNAAGRQVLIEFSPDPDIVIREEMSQDNMRNIIAIEIKGGTDFSNIHNRVGEAEKSHQKAKSDGFVECWTVVNVDRIDFSMAQRESPSTNRFYRISSLKNKTGEEYIDFKNRIIALTGITNA
ncbi:MAG TPA: XcyI family restriction endonuclease [bacterium]|nr:XcyI family restriction endonuclease [bacterium]HPS30105.1 XcyI family restriction endonuclease [bacterium]